MEDDDGADGDDEGDDEDDEDDDEDVVQLVIEEMPDDNAKPAIEAPSKDNHDHTHDHSMRVDDEDDTDETVDEDGSEGGDLSDAEEILGYFFPPLGNRCPQGFACPGRESDCDLIHPPAACELGSRCKDPGCPGHGKLCPNGYSCTEPLCTYVHSQLHAPSHPWPSYWIWPPDDYRTIKCDVSGPVLAWIKTLVAQTCRASLIGKTTDGAGHTHTGLRVTEVLRVQNTLLWRNYATQRQIVLERIDETHDEMGDLRCVDTEISRADSPPNHKLEKDVNELYLFHGTHTELVNAVCQHGVEERVSKRAMFGKGVYFTENSSKADEYSKPISDSGRLCMFLMRVIVGRPFVVLTDDIARIRETMHSGSNTNALEDMCRAPCLHYSKQCDGLRCAHGRYDTLLAPTKATHPQARLSHYREFVVFDGKHCYPEYLIYYERTGAPAQQAAPSGP
eukprot:m51a1_g12929 hypothetical protein (449) ;mRNA; f:44-1553